MIPVFFLCIFAALISKGNSILGASIMSAVATLIPTAYFVMFKAARNWRAEDKAEYIESNKELSISIERANKKIKEYEKQLANLNIPAENIELNNTSKKTEYRYNPNNYKPIEYISNDKPKALKRTKID